LSNSKFAQFLNTRYHNPHREPEKSAATIVSTRNEIKNYGNRNALRCCLKKSVNCFKSMAISNC